MADVLIQQLRSRAVDNPVPPLEDRSIARAETELGQTLPPLLRDAYTLVGNGGFGPGYGLLPLLSESPDIECVVGLFTAFSCADPGDPAWSWPRHLLPFCDWGCAIRSCVDCSSSDAAVITFDPNVRGPGEPMAVAFAQTHATLRAWFSDWLAGVQIWDLMFEPDPSRARTATNPFTREPTTVVPARLRRP